ncbi:hypothetical protein ACUULL_003472 [Vibrio cholerae]|uniref:hypothetical protein n=1 Tax=Vibrio cholerae TaxID=666 RepID=UPI0011D3F00D|nr:hypothetical protein [Vibrio cholerae]QKU64104.1 hypothetical protein HPY17_12620 [Vibrio cholerae]QKU67987.1 hypothetical protein HPY10_12660 [Vibrio cholerae]TXX50717.1 hypothetical protein FXF14_04655 [Vibrio cholerae]
MNIRIVKKQRYEAIWAVPLSGMGHIADEQPMPYIHSMGVELTPRFGGEDVTFSDLPLPYGYIKGSWPAQQRIFNLFRKRVNIYWREIFNSFNRKDKAYYIYQQCDFIGKENGYVGESPLVYFERLFTYNENCIEVSDFIKFKRRVAFSKFVFCSYSINAENKIKITASEKTNHEVSFSSSTGESKTIGKMLKDVEFEPGDTLECQYRYLLELRN